MTNDKKDKITLESLANIDLKELHAQMLNAQFNIAVEVLEGGKLPVKAHKTDAGFDLFATEDLTVYPGQVIKHPLNIKLALPPGTWAEITSKSGLGAKGLLVFAGVIDESYRGIPHVVMTNVKHTLGYSESFGKTVPNEQPILIKKGEKLAQLIMNPHNPRYFMTKVDEVSTDTDRGQGGFGSSGV